jgi:hypothetical protein
VSELVFAAFRALGTGPSKREVALVARALRESGDAKAIAMFEAAAADMRAGFDALAQIAEKAGAGPLTALDLLPEVLCPGWSPFPPGNERHAALERRVERVRSGRGRLPPAPGS